MLAALVLRSAERARGLLAALVLLLCGFQFMLAMIAAELDRTNTFSLIATLVPPAVQQMAGGSVFTSFMGFAAFGFFHPVVVLIVCEAAIFLASEPAWEVESGIVDITLARPVPRRVALTRTVLVTAASLAGLAILMAVAARAAMHAFAPAHASVFPLRTTVLLAANLAALGAWFGALSLLVSTAARRRSVALGIAGTIAVAAYLLNLFVEVSTRWASLRPLLPYHYFNSSAILRGAAGTFARDVTVLLATAAIMTIAAYRVYEERDL